MDNYEERIKHYIYMYIYTDVNDVIPLMKTAGVIENSGH